MAALAHAGHDQPPRRAPDNGNGPAEGGPQIAVQGRLQRSDTLAFERENAQRGGDDIGAAVGGLRRCSGVVALFGTIGHGSRCSLSHILSASGAKDR